MPKVSVVIPCYNQGEYLIEAIDSVVAQTFADFEIIIVNDGSTDARTIEIIGRLDFPNTRVISTLNSGLAAARNTGIFAAVSPYILPLDADDTIEPEYLAKATDILDRDADVRIVYSLAEKFGSATGRWDLPEFSAKRLCKENMIFCSALFRKADWQAVGGYDTKMKFGWEDWDFWLSLAERGAKVVRIPEVLFRYRVNSGSMTRTMGYGQKLLMMLRMIVKHRNLYIRSFCGNC